MRRVCYFPLVFPGCAQLVKNVFLSNDRRYARKAMEIVLALLIERRMTKWDILQLYLNKVRMQYGARHWAQHCAQCQTQCRIDLLEPWGVRAGSSLSYFC